MNNQSTTSSFEYKWDMRLLAWCLLSILVACVIPFFSAPYARIHFWTKGFFLGVSVVTAVLAFALPSFKEVRTRLPRWARWLAAVALAVVLTINFVRVGALAEKTTWINRAANETVGVPLSALRQPLPLPKTCQNNQLECKQLQEGWKRLAQNTTNDLDKAANDKGLADIKKENAQPTPPPVNAPHSGGSAVICQSSKFGACAIVGAAAIACMAMAPEAWQACLGGAMALLTLLGTDKDAAGMSAASSSHVGHAVANALTDRNGTPAAILAPLSSETDPKAMQVTQRAIEELVKQGKIPNQNLDPLQAELKRLETNAQQPLTEHCQGDLVAATRNVSPPNWCLVRSQLQQSGNCNRAGLSQVQQDNILKAAVNQVLSDDASRQAAFNSIAACATQ